MDTLDNELFKHSGRKLPTTTQPKRILPNFLTFADFDNPKRLTGKEKKLRKQEQKNMSFGTPARKKRKKEKRVKREK